MAVRRLRLGVLGLVLLGGCALGTQRFGREIDASRLASLEVGVSTRADVLRLFGPPTSTSRLPAVAPEASAEPADAEPSEADSNVFVYEYREDRESFLTLILYTRFRRDVLTDRLMVFFDDDDLVRYVAFAKETGERPAE